jgi:hypothetical protein
VPPLPTSFASVQLIIYVFFFFFFPVGLHLRQMHATVSHGITWREQTPSRLSLQQNLWTENETKIIPLDHQLIKGLKREREREREKTVK